MVGDEDFVGNEQHEVTLVVRALQLVLDGIELERQIIAKGAIKAEIGILLREEKPDYGAQHRKDRGHARAFFFREGADRFHNRQIDTVFAGLVDLYFRKRLDGIQNGPKQDDAARVQRLDAHRAGTRRDDDRRIDNCGIPSRIAARIFVIGREHRTAPFVQHIDIAFNGALIGREVAHPLDDDTACRFVLEYLAIRSLRIHDRLSQISFVSEYFLFRFARHAFGLIPTAKQKGRPDNPSGLSSERICTNACVAAFSEPTTNR